MHLRVVLALCVLSSAVPPSFAQLAETASPATGHGELDAPEVSPRAATISSSVYETDMSWLDFAIMDSDQAGFGKQLVDIEIRDDPTLGNRYSGIWFPVTGTVHRLLLGNSTEWSDFIDEMRPKDGRYLDVEVGYYSGAKRWSALFLEDGDNYDWAIFTTNSDSRFQSRLDTQLRAGRTIIDFEAYLEPGGAIKYAGVWVDDPNQPRTVLHYHLESEDLSDLIRPLAGRLIDFERYWSPTHGEVRYAVITAMVPGGEWSHWRNLSESTLDSKHGNSSDADTHIIDLEEWDTGSGLRYGALWGDTYKSLHEVAAIPADPDPEPIPTDLGDLIADFESADQGTIGIYAKNLRTNQSLAYRASEPFYLASSAKVPIHIKFWREVQNDPGFDETLTIPYTNCADCRDDWYVDERDWHALGLDAGDFGNSYSLDRFDRAMMGVSDNAATSALVDHPTYGVSHDATDLNEWLSGVAGVGQGFFPVTSIHDVDRTILWQGQVEAFPSETSYFLVPGWAFEGWFRQPISIDYGDLEDYLEEPDPPETDTEAGHYRYYNMGLNSGTPRAFGRLLEGLWDGDYHDATHRAEALSRMTEGTFLDQQIDPRISTYAKGGSKGGASDPRNNTAILQLGNDAFALGVFTKDNIRSVVDPDEVRAPYFPDIGREILEGLAANLRPDSTSSFGPLTVAAGQAFEATTYLRNDGGGDSFSGFDLTAYLSTNTYISTQDEPIGSVRVSPMGAGTLRFARIEGAFPSGIDPGSYYVGFVTDTAGHATFGEVGEWNENDNAAQISGVQVTVVDCLTDLVIANDTITGAESYRGDGSITLGPSLEIDGTSIDLIAGDRVVIGDGTAIGGSFSAGTDPNACSL